MTAPERRTKLKSNSTLHTLWYIILGIQALPIIVILLVALGLSAALTDGAGSVFIWALAVLFSFYAIIIFSTVYALQSWVTVLMWIGFIGAVVQILGDQSPTAMISVAVNTFSLFSYRAILKYIKS